MYSQQVLDEIRNRCDIVDLIGHYVQLNKSGQAYTGLCPFHSERTPSFHVHPLKQIYHCFGSCQKGGNVFTFLMEIEGLKFPEAVQRLAKKVGVTLQEENRAYRPVATPLAPNEKRILEALEWAAKYYNYILMNDPEYAFAKNYLTSRGITDKTIEKFHLGVSPSGWNTLLTLMQKRNFSLETLIAAGLVAPKETSPQKGYDRFRNRLMFPILTAEGRTVGFGARSLNDEDQPKYLNSSESSVFTKGKILYGIFENQRDIRLKGEAVVVEGYMDVVGLSEQGVTNAVAPMGTALTEDHCQLLKTQCQRVVTVFDPDAAGVQAWHRSVPIFINSGIFAKDVTLSDGLDPDDFVRKHGSEVFYDLCNKAPQQLTKYLREIAQTGPLGEKERTKYIQELAPILWATRRLADKGALFWDDACRVLNISLDSLRKLVEDYANRIYRAPVAAPVKPPTPVLKKSVPISKQHPLDWEFFAAAIRTPEKFLALPIQEWKGFLKIPALEPILETLWNAKTLNAFQQELEKIIAAATDPEMAGVAAAGLLSREVTATGPTQAPFPEVADRIRKRRHEAEIQSLSTQIRLSQRLGNQEEQLELLKKIKELRTYGSNLPEEPGPSTE